MMINKIKTINGNILLAGFSALALTIAMVSQHIFDMQPCAWCIAQRMMYIVIFLFSTISFLLNEKKYSFYIGSVLSLGGIGLAIYQSIVKKNPFACAQTIVDELVVNFGLNKIAPEIFEIRVFCSEENATILGIQYVYISMIGFLILLLMNIYFIKRKN